MVNTKRKQYRGDNEIMDVLKNMGFLDLYSFPHLYYKKDYVFNGEKFDAMGWFEDPEIPDIFVPYFFQFKNTNKPCKPSKKDLERYNNIEINRLCKCVWINKVTNSGIFWYDVHTNKKGTRIK